MPLFRPGSTSAPKPRLSPRPHADVTAPFHPGRTAAATAGSAPSALAAPEEAYLDAPHSIEVNAVVAAPEVEPSTPAALAAPEGDVESFQIRTPEVESVLDTASLTDGATSGWAWEEGPEAETSDASMGINAPVEAEDLGDPIDMQSPFDGNETELAIDIAHTEVVEPAAIIETEITQESADEASFIWDEPAREIQVDPVRDATPEWALPQAIVDVEVPQSEGLDVMEVAVAPNAPTVGDFQSLVLEAEGRERTLEVLATVARRVRAGEITVSADAGSSAESVLASLLASLLSTKP